MKIGIHIAKGKSLHQSIKTTCETYKMDACQIFTITPQKIQLIEFDETKLAEIVRRMGINLYIHSSYLVSPWGEKPYHLPLCVKQLKQQVALGGKGVIFHIPKVPPQLLVPRLKELIARKPAHGRILLENKAVRPVPMGSYETPEKINHLVETLIKGGVPRSEIHLIFDTAHLYCGGVMLRTYADAKKWLTQLKYPDTVAGFHLNGNSSTTFADKHAIAFGPQDLIWHGIDYSASGVRAIVEFCKKHRLDIILECDFERESKGAVAIMAAARQ